MKCGRIGNWGRRGFPAVCALTRQKVWGSSRYGGHTSNSASGQKQSGGVAVNFSICMHGAHGSSFIVEAFQYRSMRGIQTLNSSVLSVFELGPYVVAIHHYLLTLADNHIHTKNVVGQWKLRLHVACTPDHATTSSWDQSDPPSSRLHAFTHAMERHSRIMSFDRRVVSRIDYTLSLPIPAVV